MEKHLNYEAGTPRTAAADYSINIVENGPYMVYGKMPIHMQTIIGDENGNSWVYKRGKHNFQSIDLKPVALCRCGASKNKPYCDGSHIKLDWDASLTAPRIPLLDGAQQMQGPTLTLTDNRSYCAFARFCDARGGTWNQNDLSDDPHQRELAIRTASACPAGRIKEWDNRTGEPFEPQLNTELGLIEDPLIQVSGPIWVMGGIPITTPDGYTYQLRNRATLCRCGNSTNKPFCDGTHASSHFKDGLHDDR